MSVRESVDNVICAKFKQFQEGGDNRSGFLAVTIIVAIIFAAVIICTSMAIAIVNGNVANSNPTSFIDGFRIFNIIVLVLSIFGLIAWTAITAYVSEGADCQ